MKVIHYIDSLGVGGGQTMMFELYHGINKYHEGFTQEIYLRNPESVDKNFVLSNGIYYTPLSHISFVDKFNREKDTVIVYHKLMKSDTGFLRNLKIPVIVVNHTYSKNPDHLRVHAANAIVYVSDCMRQIAESHSSAAVKEVIRNGVDQQRYLGVPAEYPRTGYFMTGRINKLNTTKFSVDWLKWIYGLNLSKPLWHDYIGDGAGMKETKKIVNNNQSVNRINFTGNISDFKNKVSIIKSWDVFLYGINTAEGISMAMLEALACGVPVICDRKPSNFEVIEEGVNGFTYRSLREASDILANLCNNPDKLESLKKTTAEHFSKHLDIKIVSSRYVELLNSTRDIYVK